MYRTIRIPREPATQLRDWLHGSPSGLAVLAVLVGLGAGCGAVVFRFLILWFTEIFTGHADYSGAAGEPNPLVPALGVFFVVLAPVVGGLIYGPLVARFAPEARGHGVPEVMLAVAERGGRIRAQVAVVKALASALCIGSGGSVGREGPIVQIGSALGSTIGQMLRVPEPRLRVLVACGAAGGISATFNAPIAGVFFALELILRDFEAESFGVVVLASVIANVIGRAVFGSVSFLTLAPFEFVSYPEFLLYLGLGILAAFVGVAFVRILYGFEDLADKLWRWSDAFRPAAGGLVLGLLLLALPQMYGVGYPVLQQGIGGGYELPMLFALMAGKVVATSLTIAIGGSGGVFAPSLFIGAMLGTAYGDVVHGLWPTITAPAGAYGLVGMGAVFAGAARAPITAVLIIFELTGDYLIILPLMFAIVVAAGLGNVLARDTIYTLKLRRRGIELVGQRGTNLMSLLRVRDALGAMPQPVQADETLADLVTRFSEESVEALPVVDAGGTFRGVLSRSDVEQGAQENAVETRADELARTVSPLRPDERLDVALAQLVRAHAGLPVVDSGGHAVGWLSHQDVLRAYHAQLQQTVSEAARRSGRAAQPGAGVAGLRGYRFIELELHHQPADGVSLRALTLPASALVVAVNRDGDAFVPHGDARLLDGDRITVLVAEADEQHLRDAVLGRATS